MPDRTGVRHYKRLSFLPMGFERSNLKWRMTFLLKREAL